MKPEVLAAKSVAAGLPDAAILLDSELCPLHYNAAYMMMSGMRRQALERALAAGPARTFEVLGCAREDDAETARACMKSGRVIRLDEMEVRNTGGQAFVAIVTFIPVFDSSGAVVALLQTFRDVSAEARMQARYKELLGEERARAEDLERQVQLRTMELTAALEEVTRLSRTDPLTKLLNRRAFTEHAEHNLALADRYERTAGLLMCDLDHFKRLNDTYGHLAGDAMLAAAAGALQKVIRGTDKIARFGGEEFVILLSEADAGKVFEVGERCRQAVHELPIDQIIPAAKAPQTVSIGVAIFPQHGRSLDELVASADKALYEAKDGGRNRVVLFNESPPAKQPLPVVMPRLRALLAVEDPARAGRLRAAMQNLEVSYESSPAAALADNDRDPYDVVIADQRLGGVDGIELLHKSFVDSPNSLRLLIVDSVEAFMSLRGLDVGPVDYFILRSDEIVHLPTAIEDGLARREYQRRQLLNTPRAGVDGAEKPANEIQRILARKALDFAFQPIFDVRTGTIYGYEALCRPDSTVFCGPMELFQAAVQETRIWELGRLTRDILASRLETLPTEMMVFVNVHPAELGDPVFLQGASKLSHFANRIVFEVTERASIPDFRRFRSVLDELRSLGFRFAVDDLGAGYASLNSVALLEPSFLKIDMTMIRDITSSVTQVRLVRRIVDFANDQAIFVVAEGIETQAEAETVIELGCHLLQGFLFGPPQHGFATEGLHTELLGCPSGK